MHTKPHMRARVRTHAHTQSSYHWSVVDCSKLGGDQRMADACVTEIPLFFLIIAQSAGGVFELHKHAWNTLYLKPTYLNSLGTNVQCQSRWLYLENSMPLYLFFVQRSRLCSYLEPVQAIYHVFAWHANWQNSWTHQLSFYDAKDLTSDCCCCCFFCKSES